MKRYNLEADDTTQFKNASMYQNKDGDYIEYDNIKPLISALEELSSWTDEQLEKALYNEEEILIDILNVRKEFKKL